MNRTALTASEQEAIELFESFDKLKLYDRIMLVISFALNTAVVAFGIPFGLAMLFLTVNSIAFFACMKMNFNEKNKISDRIVEIANEEIEGDKDSREKVKMLIDIINRKQGSDDI
jgi:hypothetical protein